jgi:hypothetical protein
MQHFPTPIGSNTPVSWIFRSPGCAISETLARRGTTGPVESPPGLTREFAETDGKAAQWGGFVRRLPGTTVSTDFALVIVATAAFAGPVRMAMKESKSPIGERRCDGDRLTGSTDRHTF